MAIDINLKNIENNTGYDLRCKIFKRIPNTQLYEQKTKGVFYAKEISPFQETVININGKMKDRRMQATIETLDYVDNLSVDDKVYYKSKLYRVESISKLAISSQANSNRPSYQTTIVLIN